MTIPEVVEHLEGIVGRLDQAPIIMGHSAGGFFTQISPAGVVTELNAVVGVALEAAHDDDTLFLSVLGTLVYQHAAKLRVPLFHVLYLSRVDGLAQGDSPEARRSDQVLSVTSFRHRN